MQKLNVFQKLLSCLLHDIPSPRTRHQRRGEATSHSFQVVQSVIAGNFDIPFVRISHEMSSHSLVLFEHRRLLGNAHRRREASTASPDPNRAIEGNTCQQTLPSLRCTEPTRCGPLENQQTCSRLYFKGKRFSSMRCVLQF